MTISQRHFTTKYCLFRLQLPNALRSFCFHRAADGVPYPDAGLAPVLIGTFAKLGRSA